MYGLGNITVTVSNTLMPKFQGISVNGLGFVPMKSSSGNAFELEYVPVSKITTDEKNFQNRADKFSEKSVNAIIKAVKNGSFNWFAFDPVLLWKNPAGELVVLSGHSRTEAFRRLAAERPKIEIDGLSFDKIPAKIFKGDFLNAKNLALNSNALSTPETLLERAEFYRRERELLKNKSDIAKLREKAVRENQGSVVWDLSYLPADGLTVDSLKRFKMQEDSEAAFENYIRAVNIAQWIGKAFQIYKGLSRLHDSELFKFLTNNYGTKSGQYNSFTKLNDRLQILYPRNVVNDKKVDFNGNYTTPFGLIIYEKNDDEINEIADLESATKKAKRELDKQIKDLRGRTSDKAQIFNIVTPHFNEYVNRLFEWWTALDKEKTRKEDKNQKSLFGLGAVQRKKRQELTRSLFDNLAEKEKEFKWLRTSERDGVQLKMQLSDIVQQIDDLNNKVQSLFAKSNIFNYPAFLKKEGLTDNNKILADSLYNTPILFFAKINEEGNLKEYVIEFDTPDELTRFGKHIFGDNDLFDIEFPSKEELALAKKIEVQPRKSVIVSLQDVKTEVANDDIKMKFLNKLIDKVKNEKDYLSFKYLIDKIKNDSLFFLTKFESVYSREYYDALNKIANFVMQTFERALKTNPVKVALAITASGLNNALKKNNGLGKPTIKLEFEDNAQLLNFKNSIAQNADSELYFDGGEFKNLHGLTVNNKPAWVFNCPESMLKTNGFKPTYKRLSSYDALISSSDGAKTLVGFGFNKTTLDELKEACKYYKQVEKLAAHLKADSEAQSAFNVWHWLHTNINYNYDKAGEEEIRTPARSWADRKSGVDCDCLAVFTACLFICMGYRPKFEIVAFHNSPQYSHIFVNLNGLAVDRVLPVFGIRPSLITKKLLMEIPVYHLSGVDGCIHGLQGVYDSTLTKIFTKTATPEDTLNFRKAQVLITLQNVDPDAYKLGAIIMPHVAAIGDDGAYYFENEYVAKVAKQLDDDLQKRHLNGIYGLGKGWLKKAFKKVGNAVKKVAKATGNAVKTVAKVTANTAKAAVKSTVNAVKATANLTKAGVQAATGNTAAAKETLKKAGQQAKSAVVDPVKQAASDTKAVVKNAVVEPVKTVTEVTVINPIKETVKVAGKLFKVILVKLNPALVLIRGGLKLLIAINFLGMATRFSIGLLTEAEAAEKGYDKATWEEAKKAVDKIIRFWKKIGGKEDKLIKTIRNGATRKALFKKDYNANTKIVETGEDSATLGAVEIKILNGINGLGEGFTIASALAAVGAFFAKIWGWIKNIIPKIANVVKKVTNSKIFQTASQMIKGNKAGDAPENTVNDGGENSEKTKGNWIPWAAAAAAVGVGILAFGGKKKKKKRA